MRYSCFARYGHLRFTSKPPEAQRIYEGMVRAMGGETMVSDGGAGVDTVLHARLYAHAMRIATGKRCVDRVLGNEDPTTAVELLPYHERVWGVPPLPDDSDDERRSALETAIQVAEGCRPGTVYAVLASMLGDELIAVRKTPLAEFEVTPSNWAEQAGGGTIKDPSTPIKIRTLDTAIHTLGAQSVSTSHKGGDDAMLNVGDVVVVEPGRLGLQEAVTVTAVDGTTITANFTKPHDAGTPITTGSVPVGWCNSRHLLIVVTSTIARSTAWRKRIGAKLEKILRNVDTWDIVEEASAGVLGPMTVGGLIGVTCIPQVDTTP